MKGRGNKLVYTLEAPLQEGPIDAAQGTQEDGKCSESFLVCVSLLKHALKHSKVQHLLGEWVAEEQGKSHR